MTARNPSDASHGGFRAAFVRHGREWGTGLLFILPACVGLLALYIIPLITTVIVSLSKTGPFGDRELIGIANYQQLIEDPEFWQALTNSCIYSVIVLISIPLAILLATLINNVKRGASIYRVLFFLPVVTLPVAIGMVWRYLYNGEFGLINQGLGLLGITGANWVANPQTAIYAVSIVGIWMNLGVNIIILGAGLKSIPQDLYEASALDGAGALRQFRSITLPLLSPSIFLVSVLSVISSLQMFDLIYVMIGKGSPAEHASQTVVYLFFRKAFVEADHGYGAAIAIALLAIIMGITALQFRAQKKWVFYG